MLCPPGVLTACPILRRFPMPPGAGEELHSPHPPPLLQRSPAELQLRLSLFDAAHRHFFGHTWHSSTRTPCSAPGQPPRVLFNEV